MNDDIKYLIVPDSVDDDYEVPDIVVQEENVYGQNVYGQNIYGQNVYGTKRLRD